MLKSYPRHMESPAVHLIHNQLVACYDYTCEVYRDGSWQHLQDTLHRRLDFSSAVRGDAVLLIGGESTHTTEWISINGSPARPGPFNVTRHGDRHCNIQVSTRTIVVTGGGWPEIGFVTEYNLDDASETPMTSLLQGREDHACGFYLNNNNQQVGWGEL